MAAINGLGGPSAARKIAIDGPGGPILGGTISGMTFHLLLFFTIYHYCYTFVLIALV